MKKTMAIDTLVLLLAGGVGSRLNILVQDRAKPAVPFAGLYRIIDFSLSNVMNSGLTQVGVLTQYKPLSLMRHLGTGETWDFTGRTRGVKVLPPRTGAKDSDWYKGTADAVRQNLDFISSHPSREILLLSGDHIYQMDYSAMIDAHRQKNADLTIGMMVVDESEIHQFGAGIIDADARIIDWEEKPAVARTNLASMGIYVFNTDYLISLLVENRDEIDFGMHLIPKAIARDNVFAYSFQGYWRDVGTIQAYWEATMDVLDPGSGISPEAWGVRSNSESGAGVADWPPSRFLAGCSVSSSMISAGCVIGGDVRNSVLSPGVVVEAGARINNSIILNECVIEKNAVVDLAIFDKRVRVGRSAVVGSGENRNVPNRMYPKHLYTGITLVGKETSVPAKAVIGRNCIVSPLKNLDEFHGLVLRDGETI